MTGHTAFTITLELRPTSSAVGDASSWMLVGTDHAAWLDELAGWNVPLDQIRLLPLPTSGGNLSLAGVLAIPATPPRRPPSAAALPFRCIAGVLHVPASAVLHPPVDDAELKRLIVWPLAMMHPSLGLVGARIEELPTAMDLIDVGVPLDSSWAHAVGGERFRPRITSIEPVVVPNTDELLQSLKNDIGDESPADLDPTPEESKTHQAKTRVKVGLAKLVGGVSQHMPGEAMKKLTEWSRQQADALTSGLEQARNKELSRLIKLLEANPDEGLRYALPLNADAIRGRAPAGGRLVRRNVGFNLSDLFGAKRGDNWNVQEKMRQRLQAKYRMLATRELQLGRFRRAAYVFAHLLADFHSAADALQQGQLWREAATLYREKLGNAPRAAECLERGGLLTEAIELYTHLHQYEKAGDLFLRLNHEDQSKNSYEVAVKSSLSADDPLNAARVLEAKLSSPERALEVLTNAWPGSKQGARCLRESFSLLARQGRHADAQARVIELKEIAERDNNSDDVLNVLSDLAVTYPAAPVQTAAGDATRWVVGMTLSNATPARASSLLGLIARTAVDDPVLRRDTSRYLDMNRVSAKPQPHAPVTTPNAMRASATGDSPPTLYRTIQLQGRGWRLLKGVRDGFVALSASDAELNLACGTWTSQQFPSLAIPVGAPSDAWRVALLADRGLRIYPIGGERPWRKLISPHSNLFANISFGRELTGEALYGLASADDGSSHVFTASLSNGSGLIHSHLDRSNHLLSSHELGLPVPPTELAETCWVLTHGAHLAFSSDDEVYCWREGEVPTPIQLHGRVRSLTASRPHTVLRMIVGHDEGASLIWPTSGQVVRFASDMVLPAVRLRMNGSIVAVDANEGRLYRFQDGRIRLISKFSSRARPVQIIDAEEGGTFACLFEDGTIALFRD